MKGLVIAGDIGCIYEKDFHGLMLLVYSKNYQAKGTTLDMCLLETAIFEKLPFKRTVKLVNKVF